MIIQGGFLTVNCNPPNFSTKKKTANQPITAFLISNIYWNDSCDWLIGNFLFGTEIGCEQLKKTTLYINDIILSLPYIIHQACQCNDQKFCVC
jgi:hypothetical protein